MLVKKVKDIKNQNKFRILKYNKKIDMKNNKVLVDAVIILLNDIDCDGETMQFILEKVGMEYQMLRQLMMTMPIEQVEYLLAERNGYA